MDNIYIEGNKGIPEIHFKNNGKLSISGRSYPDDANLIYNPLLEFVASLEVNDVVFDVNLDYLNSGSIKYIKRIIHEIEDNKNIKTATVKWHFEDDDEKNKELGFMFKEISTKCKFEFK